MREDNSLQYKNRVITAALEQVATSVRFRDIDFVRSNLTFEQVVMPGLTQCLYNLRSFVLTNVDASETIEWSDYPNWFEHFKDEVFPMWLKRYFPVKKIDHSAYTSQQKRVCPHLPIKIKEHEHFVHMNFLAAESQP